MDWLGIAQPILLAPMAGPGGAALAIAVAEAGGLGALACAMLTANQVRAEFALIRARTAAPVNLNFFCHTPPLPDPAREAAWLARLAPHYAQHGLDPAAPVTAANRAPFDAAMCEVMEAIRPGAVSFHFGLPADTYLERLRRAGNRIFGCATTVAEARYLADRGVDAIIAQGIEAGGHRGMFLSDDLATQTGTLALVPLIADAVDVPVIAAGGIMDGRGIRAALALGAAAVQLGTAYLFCPEAKVSPPFRAALATAADKPTYLTNVMTGRPARGLLNRVMRELGPLAADVPAFPGAATPLAPLRAKAEEAGLGDFSPLWAGQAVALGRAMGAGELTRALVKEAGL
jgi:nitronate monooxygenase